MCSNLSPEVRDSFATALGYVSHSEKGKALEDAPYAGYILAQCPVKERLDDYARQIVKVVEHFTGTSSPGHLVQLLSRC